jgi:hypothetical protein
MAGSLDNGTHSRLWNKAFCDIVLAAAPRNPLSRDIGRRRSRDVFVVHTSKGVPPRGAGRARSIRMPLFRLDA